MQNARYILRLISAFFQRFKAIIVIGVVIGIVFFLILRFVLPIFTGGVTQKIGLTGRFSTVNLPNYIQEMVGDGLTSLNESSEVEPNLAQSWETPDKGKTWIFHLKKDKTWQDGKLVTSDTISYQFSDVAVERPDAQTIIFKLQNPYSAFPSIVSKPVFRKGLLGTDSWRVKKLSLSGNFITQMTIENGKNRIIFKFYPTEERTKLAFKLGAVGEISDIVNLNPFNAWEKVKIEEKVDMGEYVAVFFNTQDKLLGDKNLRQALSYAIKKDYPYRALGPISINSWAYNPQVKPYSYDKEKAQKTISELPKDVQEGLSITLTTSPILLSEAEKIAKDWNEIGVKTNVQVISSIQPDYQALLAIFDIPEDPDQYSIWHSTQTSSNITNYKDPRIDKLLEDGRTQLDLGERKKIYFDFQRFLVEDSPAAFLYYPVTYTVKRN